MPSFFFSRLGAASKESYHEDTYPNLLHSYLKFDDEMSVISVVWRDSHQLIEQYNEEQVGGFKMYFYTDNAVHQIWLILV